MLSRRSALAAGGAMVLGGVMSRAVGQSAPPPGAFVEIDGKRLSLGGRPYRFAGTNMWYAAYLGADAPFGDRARLRRELAAMAATGITNVRLLGASEASPLSGAPQPAMVDHKGARNEVLLAGLDYALAEMGKLGLKAVIYLNNFWDWSGGMMVYLNWTTGQYIKMGDPAYPWPAYPDTVSAFYSDAKAVAMSHAYIRALVTRTNTVTGGRYADDPAIMAWQLANEPRPGESASVAARVMPAYLAWIRDTAGLIKSLDRRHLVSIGLEGTIGCAGSARCVTDANGVPGVDYMTIHIWPQNFGWLDPADMAGTWAKTETNTRDYIARHVALARSAGKPLVIEEFGFPRDGLTYDPGTPTTYKDRFYRLIYDAVARDAAAGGPLSGSNCWAWSGEGRAAHGDHLYRQGDTSYLGDPSHEPQGWYSVFDVDRSTRAVIAGHAQALRQMSRAA